MIVVVDTSVWSLVIRRKKIDEANPYVRQFRRNLAERDYIHLIGPILQELLDGVASTTDFDHLREALEPFPLLPLSRDSFMDASRLRNRCRKAGIQASSVDFLIASACIEHGAPLLTADKDFARIARVSDLELIEIQSTQT